MYSGVFSTKLIKSFAHQLVPPLASLMYTRGVVDNELTWFDDACS
jgi:hypothetical protein